MIRSQTIVYEKNWVHTKARYNCKCGNKFYRENNDWFTINFMNKHKPFHEIYKKVKKECHERKRICPKCNVECNISKIL